MKLDFSSFTKFSRLKKTLLFGALGLILTCNSACPSTLVLPESRRAGNILEATGVTGGLVVHLGCGNGHLTAALGVNDSYLVHGLDSDPSNIAGARKYIRSLDLTQRVSVSLLTASHLPYVDGLVNLVIAEDAASVSMDEIMRVLCPRGVAYVKQGGSWEKTVKPKPKGIDEWTHALHGPDNNAVARDTVVGPPRHLQWIGTPKWARSHDHLSSVSGVLSSGGRIFSIVDEGPAAAVALPSKWRLVARDAFNGVVLWKRRMQPWENRLRGFRTGPASLSKRMVATGDRVYVTLGYGAPVSALNARTGNTLKTYGDTEGALELIYKNGVLFVVTGDLTGHGAGSSSRVRGAYLSPGNKELLAVDAETEGVLWRRPAGELMPTTLAVAEGKVFYQNTKEVLCLDAQTGRENWHADRPASVNRWAWSAPTLVVHKGVVLSADRAASSKVHKEGVNEEHVLWVVSSRGGQAPQGKLIAFSAETGERLWSCPCRESYNAPVDILVADGLVWTGTLVRANQPGITKGRNINTGEVERTRPPDGKFFHVGMGHHRCYRNKATDNYLVLGRSGVEFVDLKSGKGIANHWVRGACQYGVLPCNGLLYAPSHSCACYIEAKLNGFNALAPKGARNFFKSKKRLQRGPAYGKAAKRTTAEGEWPTYRYDPARSGFTNSQVPSQLKESWSAKLQGKLTSPVVASGKLFVAQKESHALYALDADSGRSVWSRTTGGRIDSPPTIYKGLALFGCADGYVYCVRASDGELVWRFLAAPGDHRLVAYGQLESVWPVHGNILIHNGSAYFAAGRSSYVDGGMYLYRLDPVTGKVISKTHLNSRDPETGLEPQKNVRGVSMPGALPDILSTDGSSVYMRHLRFDQNLTKQSLNVPHLFSPAGFLDGSWWHRTYWVFGTRMKTGWGGWARAGYKVPAGRILAVDESRVYGFGRLKQYGTHGAHVGLDDPLLPWPYPGGDQTRKAEYKLFACTKPSVETGPEAARERRRGRGGGDNFKSLWVEQPEIWVRAMLVAGNKLFVAGPPKVFLLDGAQRDVAAFLGAKGGVLFTYSTDTGKKLSRYKLHSPPVFDGMAAAEGRLYVVTTGGRVICLAGK